MSDAQLPTGIANDYRTGWAAAALAPVFIYSGYRTSSTWLWSKFRKDEKACAYYEPFNEILAGLKPDAILSARPDSWRSHHPGDAAYMAEYGPLLGNDPGVPLFPHGDPNGQRYVGAKGVDGPLDPDVFAYVSNLITSAQARGRVPLLACTRMLGRAAGLSSAFGGCHILLIRNLFQQWCSYSGQLRFGNDYFFQKLHDSFNIGPRNKYISFLSGFFSESEIADFSLWMNPINHDRIFCYFTAFHAYFLMNARRKADIIIDANRLVRLGISYQEEIASLVAARTGLRIDLADVRESVDYPVQPLKSADDCRMLLQAMLDGLLLSEARDDEDRRFVAGLIADLWDEHARFTAATAGAAEVIAGEIAKAQDEALRRAEAEALQAQTSANLAEVEREFAVKIDAITSKAEDDLAKAQSAAAEASSQLEVTLQQVARLERELADEAQAHTAANAAAQLAAALASSRIGTATRELALLERQGAEQARSHALALGAANDRLAAAESSLTDANQRLTALQQDRLALARENGRLEGQLAAQIESNAARLADAAAVRRDLASRLTRAESALATTQAEAASLRTELAVQARDHEAALAAADARQAAQAAALATAQSDVDRLGRAAATLSRQLADSDGQRQGLAEQNRELASQRDDLAAQMEAARQQAAEQVQALQSEIARLNAHIAWREPQLQQAAGLLAAIPDPLAGLPRPLAALVRRVAGEARVAAFADLQAAVAHWQSGAMLPAAPAASQGGDLSLAGNVEVADTAFIHEVFAMVESDGPITSVPRLLAPHDRHFIHTAYQAVLGRAPDAEGEAYYLTRLRAGVHKLVILRQMRQSSEGRAFIPGVAGLDRAIKRHHLANLPVVGALLRAQTGAEGDGAVERQLRALANELDCLRREQGQLVAATLALADRTVPAAPVAVPVDPVAAPEVERPSLKVVTAQWRPVDGFDDFLVRFQTMIAGSREAAALARR
jgi:hypothetical protein